MNKSYSWVVGFSWFGLC